MYFNFDDDRPDTPRLPAPLSRREVVLIVVNLHAFFLIAILLGPRLPFVRQILEQRQQAMEEQARAELEKQRERERERARFVFVQPRIDRPSPLVSPRADLSDLDRRAQTVERAPKPTNPLPFARGNSPERVEAAPTPPPTQPTVPEPQQQARNDSEAGKPPVSLDGPLAPERPPDQTRQDSRGPAVGTIADAIRNVRRYAQHESFQNQRGGEDANLGESIQFDSKGVDFGWWLRRFVAQVRSNWIIPQAAMSMRGHVSITFIIHKDGRITDVMVSQPSAVSAFTTAARGAIVMSNPTVALPPEYPAPMMPITVTFYYNEEPPGGR
jgi:TonB family protein